MRGVTLDSAHSDQLRYRVLNAAKATPGVLRASLSASVPFWSSWSTSLFVAGIDTVGRLGQFNLNSVSPDFFVTIGTRIIRGRGFTDADSRTAAKVMVVSEGMARVLWPGKDPMGQCARVDADTMPCTSVVGIAEDIRQRSISADSGLLFLLPPRRADARLRWTDGAHRGRREFLRRIDSALAPARDARRVVHHRDAIPRRHRLADEIVGTRRDDVRGVRCARADARRHRTVQRHRLQRRATDARDWACAWRSARRHATSSG